MFHPDVKSGCHRSLDRDLAEMRGTAQKNS
jgi:hypothetical protein